LYISAIFLRDDIGLGNWVSFLQAARSLLHSFSSLVIIEWRDWRNWGLDGEGDVDTAALGKSEQIKNHTSCFFFIASFLAFFNSSSSIGAAFTNGMKSRVSAEIKSGNKDELFKP
jgi:hypothetical protein